MNQNILISCYPKSTPNALAYKSFISCNYWFNFIECYLDDVSAIKWLRINKFHSKQLNKLHLKSMVHFHHCNKYKQNIRKINIISYFNFSMPFEIKN